MARILFATVPLSGHVNPGIPIAQRLVQLGHEVVWYCGRYFRDAIAATGARFEPFRSAPDFHDSTIEDLHGRIPVSSLLAHSKFYVRHVFYKPMPAYYADMKAILQDFDANLIICDEWFTGGIPFSEKGEKKVVLYGNSPLMMLSPDAPAPGTGLQPDHSIYGRTRDKITNAIVRMLFRPLERDINTLRAETGLPPMQHFFTEQPVAHATLVLKFNTEIFEYPRKYIPPNIRFAGPVIPPPDKGMDFKWKDKLTQDKPLIFITQGSVDIYDISKLIIPALKALQNEDYLIAVSTGGKAVDGLRSRFPDPDIIIEPYIPYPLIMPHVKVMITNGGYGGVSTALSHGVPLIVAGNSEDKPEIASRIVYCGAGIDLKTGKPSPSRILKAVKRILNKPEYRLNAEKVRDDFNRHDAVEESIKLIGQLL